MSAFSGVTVAVSTRPDATVPQESPHATAFASAARIAGLAVEGEPPRIAEAVGVDLGPGLRAPHERVGARDRVGPATGGARIDPEGQIVVDQCMRTSVPRLYAAGCVTPANCQMIIAAGQGATAAQAINRDLFEESLKNHSLRRFREAQLEDERTVPEEG